MKTILVDAVNTFVIKEGGIFKEMHNLLEGYPNRKIVLTNANDEQIKLFGLDKLPYELFTLKHNPEKTSSDYFKTFLNIYNLDADEVLYFEHNIDAVNSARSVGIRSCVYDYESKDLGKLKEFLDKNID